MCYIQVVSCIINLKYVKLTALVRNLSVFFEKNAATLRLHEISILVLA